MTSSALYSWEPIVKDPNLLALRSELLIIAGRLAVGEAIPRTEADPPFSVFVTRLCADRQMSHTEIALIAVTLARVIDG